MTYREIRSKAAGRLRDAGIENEQAESEFLLEYACSADLNFYLLHQNDEMPQEQERIFQNLLKQRCDRIPLQHLTGEQEFMGLPFFVNENVLIPRQDTELLVEEALGYLKNKSDKENELCAFEQEQKIRVLDLCTGSGCIAVSLKKHCPEIVVTGSDLSEEALRVAERNAERNDADVMFVCSDLFSDLDGNPDGRFHLIVSNPPYIPTDVIPTLMPEVRDHEPELALDGRADGLFFYQKIIEEADRFLFSGGCLMFEIGYDQGTAVSELMREAGYTKIEVVPDLQGLDRVVKGRRLEYV
ncbi:MAG: peptide chain release factor N(5)-glutamine methyltransferase [Clostridiales bacterium]|nr:peptide chain release factor N(5)-glutamine methyltransferase [Clostridiales bacterium]